MRPAALRAEAANERIEDVKPTIPLGARFWPLSTIEKDEIRRIFDREDVH
jgi:hypothetical protein